MAAYQMFELLTSCHCWILHVHHLRVGAKDVELS